MEANSRMQQDKIPMPQTCMGRINYYEKVGVAISGVAAIGSHIAWSSLGASYLVQVEGIENPREETWMNSLLPLGAILGTLPAGLLADKYGRKFVTAFFALPMLISWFIICFVQTQAGLYAARFTAGIGCGAATIVVPIYFFEIINSDKQRHIVHFIHWVLNLGMLWPYIAYLKYSPPTEPNTKVFEGPRILATGMTSLLVLFILALPESPMWLENRGQKEKAERAIKKITGYSITLDRTEPVKVIGNSGLRWSAFKTINNKKDFIVILLLITFQQFTGIGPLTFYLKEILDSMVYGTTDFWVYYVILLVPTLLSFTLIKTYQCIGEKFSLMISTCLMTICGFFLAVFAFLAHAEDFQSLFVSPILPMLVMTLYLSAFHFGLGPIPWIMIGKMFPINNRKMMYSLAATYTWTLVFITTKTYVDIVASIGVGGLFFVFISNSLTTMIFSLCFVPRRVKQIQEEILENLDEINRSHNV